MVSGSRGSCWNRGHRYRFWSATLRRDVRSFTLDLVAFDLLGLDDHTSSARRHQGWSLGLCMAHGRVLRHPPALGNSMGGNGDCLCFSDTNLALFSSRSSVSPLSDLQWSLERIGVSWGFASRSHLVDAHEVLGHVACRLRFDGAPASSRKVMAPLLRVDSFDAEQFAVSE